MIEAHEENRLIEAFGCGTAAVICPIKEITFIDKVIPIKLGSTGVIGDLGKWIFDKLSEIHYGNEKYKDWSRIVKC